MTDRRDTLGRFNLEDIFVRMKGLMEGVHSSLGDGDIPSRKLLRNQCQPQTAGPNQGFECGGSRRWHAQAKG